MNDGNAEKKKDKKIIIKFVAGVACCFAGGFAVGILAVKISRLNWDWAGFMREAERIMVYAVPLAFLVLNAVTGLMCVGKLRRAENIYRNWDGEDESINGVDEILNQGTSIESVVSILNCLLFAAGVQPIFREDFSGKGLVVYWLVITLLFLLSGALTVILQKKTVEITKRINPEKRGNIFDFHFQKEWEKSCDEAQKLYMYKAAYRAYWNTQITCVMLWVLCVICSFVLETGLFPSSFRILRKGTRSLPQAYIYQGNAP